MRLFTKLIVLIVKLFGPITAVWRSRRDPGLLIQSILLLLNQLADKGVFDISYDKSILESLSVRDLDKIYAEVRALALRNGVKA